MAKGDKPVARIKFKSKDGKRYDVGTLWPGNREDSHGLAPVKQDDLDAKYPKMRLSEAARLAEEGQGYLDVWMDTSREASRPQRDDFEDDIPF